MQEACARSDRSTWLSWVSLSIPYGGKAGREPCNVHVSRGKSSGRMADVTFWNKAAYSGALISLPKTRHCPPDPAAFFSLNAEKPMAQIITAGI